MLATHYTGKAQPARSKKKDWSTSQHVSPPLKGMSLATRFSVGDAQTATVLTNLVIEDDCLRARAGYRKISSRGTMPVWHLVPYYGTPTRLAAASNHELWDAQNGTLLKSGFTSDDWHWTSFSNFSSREFTVMVNGADGVWSWDGGSVADGPVVNVVSISKANPAVVTVAAADIGKFTSGQTVLIAGATGDYTVCNGMHPIATVNSPVNTFTLPDVNTSTAVGTSNAGITVKTLGSFVKEAITAPAGEQWVSPQIFHIVITHMNRLFFADPSNLAIYYLPLLQKSGTLKMLPLNAMFRRGGYIRAMYTWTIDSGTNLNDQLVIFSTNGEAVIFGGTDPDSDFKLSGIFRFDSPMSKHSVVNYGGELYVLISTGLVPMSTLIKAETDYLGQSERQVVSLFLNDAVNYRDDTGWQTFLNPSSGRLICNIPQGANNRYQQMVRHMPRSVWSEWHDIPSRCWGWIDPFIYFGDDSGNVYEMHPVHLSDDGKPINVTVQMAWNQFKTPAEKQFKGVTTYMTTDGTPHPSIDVKTDYDYSLGVNYPDITDMTIGAAWDVDNWDVALWAPGESAVKLWNGVAASGTVGAVRMSAAVFNCKFAINGWDVHFEEGKLGP
jgi:hypothetical protein